MGKYNFSYGKQTQRMDRKKFNKTKLPTIKILNIKSGYKYMDPELVNILKLEIEKNLC